MSWLLGAGQPTALQRFDILLEATTSDLLPTPSNVSSGNPSIPPDTLDKALELSDLVRSGQVKPNEAVKGFRRRLNHTNPNVQLYALITLDVAIKNSGDSFLKEIANGGTAGGVLSGVGGRGLVEELGDLARTNGNSDVKATVLRLLQNWATAFESKPNLAISELVLMYRRLRSEGQPFPPRDSSATAAMIDSMAAPEWTESDVCSRCREAFTVLNRRHHCRNCGQIFDQKCSSKTLPLPHFGISEEVRVCDGCHKKLTSGRRASIASSSPRDVPERASSHRHSYSSSVPNGILQARAPRTRNQEDDDLQLALRLSLADSGGVAQSNGYSPSYELRNKSANGPSSQPVGLGDAEDPELAAAIEASLREMQNQKPVPATPNAAPTLPNVPMPIDLSIQDTDSLLSFAQTVGQARQSSRPPNVHAMTPAYERATAARPQLVRAVQDADKRHRLTSAGHAPYPPQPYAAPQPYPASQAYAAPPTHAASTIYPSLPPQEDRRYASPQPTEPLRSSASYGSTQPTHYASAHPGPSTAPQERYYSQHEPQQAAPPQAYAPAPSMPPAESPRNDPYQSAAPQPEQQQAAYQPSAPFATPAIEASAPFASPTPSTSELPPQAQPYYNAPSQAQQWAQAPTPQPSYAPQPQHQTYEPSQPPQHEQHPARQQTYSTPVPSQPPAQQQQRPPQHLYNEASFPAVPNTTLANPWNEEAALSNELERREAPLIEF